MIIITLSKYTKRLYLAEIPDVCVFVWFGSYVCLLSFDSLIDESINKIIRQKNSWIIVLSTLGFVNSDDLFCRDNKINCKTKNNI